MRHGPPACYPDPIFGPQKQVGQLRVEQFGFAKAVSWSTVQDINHAPVPCEHAAAPQPGEQEKIEQNHRTVHHS